MINFKRTLEIAGNSGFLQPIELVQYDDTLPIGLFQITENGQAFTIPSGAKAKVRMRKADGKGVYNDAEISGNAVKVVFTQQMTAAYGTGFLNIELTYDGGVKSTEQIQIVVTENAVQQGSIESTDEFLTLEEIVKQVEMLRQQTAIDAAAASASKTAAASSATAAASSALSAQESKDSAESSKIDAANSTSAALKSKNEAVASAQAAKLSETNAKVSESTAVSSAKSATDAKNAAMNSEISAKTSETNAKASEVAAANSATLSESWAIGGTGSRDGEDLNNSKYFSQQAEMAKNSAEAAKSQATNSANAAKSSETNAANSKTAAAVSASSAANDAKRAEAAADKAQSIAQGQKGWYSTDVDLKQSNPTGENGDWAIVGSTDSVWVWDSDTGQWKDSHQGMELVNYYTKMQSDQRYATAAQGQKADSALQQTSDVSSTVVAFSTSASRTNIASGEKLSVLFGKIAKWFADLKSVAFSGSYTDLTGTPTSLKNPYALILSLNGTSQGGYDGSVSKSINITPAGIGAAASSHAHNYAGSSSAGGAATTALACTGNAATATKLQTARTINGTSFDGSANITTANWGTARTITIGKTAKSVNGGANVSWSFAELGILDFVYPVGSIFEWSNNGVSSAPDLSTVAKVQAHFGGTWEEYGKGMVTVGVDTAQTEFNTLGKTGGAKTHSLTGPQTGPHGHDWVAWAGTVDRNGQYTALGGFKGGSWDTIEGGNVTYVGGSGIRTSGQGEPHNNLQPYITVYRYRRIG